MSLKIKRLLSKLEEQQVKRLLSIPVEKNFPRCPGKSRIRMRQLWAKGEKFHANKHHICEECRCHKVAGWGTKGDYWGIGEHAGHFGVGYCRYHERGFTEEQKVRVARQHMEALQTMGDKLLAPGEFEISAEKKAKEAERYTEIRKGVDLVCDTLKKFERQVKRKDMSEYANGVLSPASDETIMRLSLDIAKTLASLNVSEHKITRDAYIHVDELRIRIPKMISLFKRLLSKYDDLKIKFKDGDRVPQDQINDEMLLGLKDIWTDVERG